MEAEKRQPDLGKPVVLNFVESVNLVTISVSVGAIIHAKVSHAQESEINELFYFSSVRFRFKVDVFCNKTAAVITLLISPMIFSCSRNEDCMFRLLQGHTLLSPHYKMDDMP